MSSPATAKPTFTPVPIKAGGELNWVVKIMAIVACVAVGNRYSTAMSISLPVVFAIGLFPLWVGAIRRFPRILVVTVLGLFAIVGGLVANEFSRAEREISVSLAINNSIQVLSVVGSVALLLWARTVLGSKAVGLWFAIGLASALGYRNFSATDLWKFSLALPTVLLLLAIAAYAQRRWVEILVLVSLAAVSALNDTRSTASILLLTATLVAWQALYQNLRVRSTTTRTVALFAAVGIGGYFTLQSFLLEGVLGDAARERTEAQIELAGTLLAGGRPEMGASIALIADNIWGYGSGALPSGGDIQVAKTGMLGLTYEADVNYVNRYMFGSGYEVHSIFGDFWIRYGLPGAIFIIVALVMVLIGAARLFARQQASALTLFLAIQFVWDCLFSPFFFSTIVVMVLALALTAPERKLPSGHETQEAGVRSIRR